MSDRVERWIAQNFPGVPVGKIVLQEANVTDGEGHFAPSEDTVIVSTESSSTASSITVPESDPDKVQVNEISFEFTWMVSE